MKKLSGFSLMEMMVVLLIVSVVAAASAPMINRRMVASTTNKSYWSPVGISGSIGYNLRGSDSQTAVIGRNSVPKDIGNARLYLDSSGTVPQLALGQKGSNIIKLLASDTSIFLTDNVDNFNPAGNQTVLGYGAQSDKKASNTTAIGYKAKAEANSSVALGTNATSKGIESVAIGYNSKSTGASSIAIGENNTSQGDRSIVIGHDVSLNTNDSIAMGSGITTGGTNIIAMGRNVSAGKDSIALGIGGDKTNTTAGRTAIAIGHRTFAGDNTVALGYNAQGNSQDVVIGTNTSSARSANETAQTTTGSVVIGRNARSSNTDGIAIGSFARAVGGSSIAIGSTASGNRTSNTEGDSSTHNYDPNLSKWEFYEKSYSGTDAHKQAHSTEAAGNGSIAIGDGPVSGGLRSIAIGYVAFSRGDHSIAFGYEPLAKGTNSIAIGYNTEALANNSVAIGANATADKENQIVLGSANDTVYIPGNLVVAGDVLLGSNGHSVYAHISSADNDYFEFKYHHDKCTVKTNSWPKSVTVGDITLTSDRRLKNVGKVFNSGLAEIRKLEVFNYTFKADKSKTPRVGIMAQDLQKIFPNAVTKGEDGFLRIRMEDMFYALVNAVKENDSRITALEKENIELKKRLSELEKKIK